MKKIKSDFTTEMITDLENLHGLDINAEVEKTLANELKNALRREKRREKIIGIFNKHE